MMWDPSGTLAFSLRGIAVVLCGMLTASSTPAMGAEARKTDAPKGAKTDKEEPKRGGVEETPLDEGKTEPLVVPTGGYAAKLEKAITEKRDSGGLHLEVSVIPDYYRYRMAQEFEELEKRNLDQARLRNALAGLHRKLWAENGRTCLLISISTDDAKAQLFLQDKSIKSHLDVRAEDPRTVRVLKEDPKPQLDVWKIFVGGNQSNSKKLFMFQNLKASATFLLATKSDEVPGTVSVSLKNIVRVVDRRDENRKDYRVQEMVNVGLKQITTSNWDQHIVKDVVISFSPNRWKEKVPKPPKGFDALLARLKREKGK